LSGFRPRIRLQYPSTVPSACKPTFHLYLTVPFLNIVLSAYRSRINIFSPFSCVLTYKVSDVLRVGFENFFDGQHPLCPPSTSMRGVTRTGSFGRVDTLRTSNPPSRSSSFNRGEKPPSLQRLPPLSNASATLPRDAERRSRSSGCAGGDYVTVLEIGAGGGATEMRSRTVPRTRPSGGYERVSGSSNSRPVSRSNSQECERPLYALILRLKRKLIRSYVTSFVY
jgi:hypothetical protein